MRGLRYAILLSLLLTQSLLADWQQDLDSLIAADTQAEQERLLSRIQAAAPNWQEVAGRIEQVEFATSSTDTLVLSETTCIDGVVRPWVLYIPPDYDPTRPTPLWVVLHGGVGRSEIFDDPLQVASEHEFLVPAGKFGWLVLFPFGQTGATWWDKVGMTNIADLLHRVKREYNVDDDRVWMGGFSDGASASFGYAMLQPTDYAAFIALNGHIGVDNLDGNLSTYAPNLANRPVYAVTTDQDGLYPTAMMRPTIELALEAGANLLYRTHPGAHEFTYANEELPLLADFLMRHPRDPFGSRLVWETASSRFGRCDWFSIDKITSERASSWYHDYNMPLVDSSIVIGFMAGDTVDGEGVLVDRVAEGEYLAGDIGLESGDVIIAANDLRIANMDDLDTFKSQLRRGDQVKLTVVRNGSHVVLSGRLPGPANYLLFKRDRPSAVARVVACGNRVDIQSSRLGALTIRVHPGMFKLDRNLVIAVDGEVVYDTRVKPDVGYMLREFLKNRDRRLLYVAEVKVDLQRVQQ